MSAAAHRIAAFQAPAVRAVEPQSRLSTLPFAAALVEVCARIWLELERLAESSECLSAPAESPKLLLMAETLRLELLLLLDSCDSAFCRTLLAAEQRGMLRRLILDVLAAIEFAADGLERSAIEQAQDRLLGEVQAQYSAAFST